MNNIMMPMGFIADDASIQAKNEDMETPASMFELLIERIEAYSKTTFELTKFRLLETSTNIVTSVVSRLSVIIMVVLFTVVLSVGVALLLGEWLGKSYYGFFIVAAFYLAAAIVLRFFLRKWIRKSVSELIIVEVLQ